MIPDFILKGDKQDAAPEAVRCTELIQEYIKNRRPSYYRKFVLVR